MESCFLLAQAQMRPAAATSLPCTMVLTPVSPSLTSFLLTLPVPLFYPLPTLLLFPLSPTLSLVFPLTLILLSALWQHTARARSPARLLTGALNLETQLGWEL